MRILTIIGARPQIIKAAALSRAIKNGFSNQIKEVIVHTGQHYDSNMSKVFFDELGIPKPEYNLNVGSASHGRQTAQMIIGIEELLDIEKPDYIILYGDTNSTLAGAIAAAKVHVPIVHIEAGLRSFNKRMPEEINRIMCDHASSLLFSPTRTGFENLKREGFKVNKAPFTSDNPGIFHCGDIMFDNSLHYANIAEKKTSIISSLKLEEHNYILSTIHRDHNTDQPKTLGEIFEGLIEISEEENLQIVLPLHPRTKKKLANLDGYIKTKLVNTHSIKIIEPVSFLEMIALEKNARLIITDSGGVQKEAYFFNKPSIILREQTEWVEILETATGLLAGSSKLKIKSSVEHLFNKKLEFPPIFGDGKAAEFICERMLENFRLT